MGTTHVRIHEDLKEKLLDAEGENFTERIYNFNSGNTENVNKDVNENQDLQDLKDMIKDVNKALTSIETLDKRDIDEVMSRYV